MSDSAFADFTEQVLSLSYEQTIILIGKMLESLKNKRNEENYAEMENDIAEAQLMPCGINLRMTHGEIWPIDFGIPVGSLPLKIRPAVVMQNDCLA